MQVWRVEERRVEMRVVRADDNVESSVWASGGGFPSCRLAFEIVLDFDLEVDFVFFSGVRFVTPPLYVFVGGGGFGPFWPGRSPPVLGLIVVCIVRTILSIRL